MEVKIYVMGKSCWKFFLCEI